MKLSGLKRMKKRKALDEMDQEHADRIAEVEHRISQLLLKKRKGDTYVEKKLSGNLEERIADISEAASAISQEKLQQDNLLQSLHDDMKKREVELKTAISANADHFAKLAADEAERLINGHTIGPPVGQPLPTDPGAPNSITDLQQKADAIKKQEADDAANQIAIAKAKIESDKEAAAKPAMYPAKIGGPPITIVERVIPVAPLVEQVVSVPVPVPIRVEVV